MQQIDKTEKQNLETQREQLIAVIEKLFSIPKVKHGDKKPEPQSLDFISRITLVFALKNAIRETFPHIATCHEDDLNAVFEATRALLRRPRF